MGVAKQALGQPRITPLWARCVIVITLDLMYTWVTNTWLYPSFVNVLPAARECSSFAGVLTMFVLAWLSYKHAEKISKRVWSAVAVGMFLAGMALVFVALWIGSPQLLVVGAVVRSIASRWCVVVAGLQLCALGGKSCMSAIAVAYLANYALRYFVGALPDMIVLCFLAAIPLAQLALSYRDAEPCFAAMREVPSANVASLVQPASFLPFSHRLFVAIFLFRAAYGFAIAYGATEGNPQQAFLSVIPLAFVAVFLALPQLPRADVLYQVAALFVVSGLISALVFTGTIDAPGSLPNGLLYAGSECFDVLMWFVLASVGARNPANAFMVFAWGRGTSSLGILAGTSFGHATNFSSDPFATSLWIAVVLFVFVALNFTVLERFSFQKVIDGVQKTEPVEPQLVQVAGLDELCAIAAKRYRLTPRETEIMELLAHGRNGPFIQEKLVISRNTIKTHVSNIYAKMGVHSQQELIDLVEGTPAKG